MKRLSTLLMLAILFVASIFAQNREVGIHTDEYVLIKGF